MKRSSTADGYIRVSRRAGREGESFISPEVQRKKIAAWAKLHEVEIVEWWEEIDQSGAKLERPMFQQALARCEAGETGGIVVARLDRFARSAVDALSSIRRLNDAGARLVSVEENFDGSTPMGRFAIGILILIAELELERIKSGWEAAVSQAVGRGIHIHVAHAVVVLQHRHFRFRRHALNQRLPAARNREVDVLAHRQQVAHRLSVGPRHELHRVRGQAGVLQLLAQ